MIVVYILLCLFMVNLYARQRQPYMTAFLSSGCGMLGLAGLYFAAPLTGIPIAVNFFTVSAALIFGLPGMVGILFLNLI